MTRAAARAAAEDMATRLMQRFGDDVSNLTYGWKGDLFELSGRILIGNITATLEVADTELRLEATGVPFFLEGRARKWIDRWFDENWPE